MTGYVSVEHDSISLLYKSNSLCLFYSEYLHRT